MKSTFISRENNEVKFSIEFTTEEFEAAKITVYQEQKHKFNIDGFRTGKAPRKLIETHYGEDIFYEDALNEMLSPGYVEAINQHDILPVDRPSMEFSEIKKGEGITATVTVTVIPEIEIKDYKGVKIKKIEHKATDKDVEKELDELRTRNARLIVVDRPAENGDTVILDYSGFVGEEQFEGGTAERHTLKLGSNTFIPGFEEQLIGAVTGVDIDVNVTFPEEYHSEDLAGKEAVFKCKVHEIKTEEKPELNDEFAQDVSEFDTLEELKKSTLEKLEESAKMKTEYESKNAALEQVYNANDIDIPEIMIENQIDEMVDEFAQQLQQQGLDINQYLQYLNQDIKEFRETLRADGYKKTKTRLIVKAIVDAEKIEASDEDIETETQAMATQYQMDVEELREVLKKGNLDLLKNDIKNRKALEILFENAVIE